MQMELCVTQLLHQLHYVLSVGQGIVSLFDGWLVGVSEAPEVWRYNSKMFS